MNSIHIADAQGQQQSYDPQEALRLWNEGAIPRDALYWQEGMTDWRPALEYFSSPPAPTMPDALPPVISHPVPCGFVKDPTRLTRFLMVMLWINLSMSGLAALVTASMLVTGQVGKPETDELTLQDLVGVLVSVPQLLIFITTGVIFLMWIHRANRNARGLGAQGMTFTPGWSVGWYFIPIATLWKPYQAMKQIWKASADPASWPSQQPPALLPTWWTLWIISNLLGNLSMRMSIRSDAGSGTIASEIVSLISDLIDIPLCLVSMRLVREIIRLQTHWATQSGQHSASNCGICGQPKASSDLIYLNHTWVCAQCKPVLLQQIREGGLKP